MTHCAEFLKRALEAPFKDESPAMIDTIARTLDRILNEGEARVDELRALPEGIDALLLMDSWRLVQPVGGSVTKAWEDVSQLLATGRNFELIMPPWIATLARRACESGRFEYREAILTFFSDEEHPAWLKMPGFLFTLSERSRDGIIDSAAINRLLREMPIGVSADTLIAQLKSYGFISPHLRADFFRMRTPHYELHPLLVHAVAREDDSPEPTP